MADLFRKTSLEQLSSPEQLDRMIVITPPAFWVAMLGAAGMIAAALIWSIFGRLPVNVEANGIYVNDGGTYTVYSESAGIVHNVVVSEGETVEEGDVIAYLDDTDLMSKLEEFNQRIAMVEAVTMTSEGDVVTADNQRLIEIKNQMLTLDQNLAQNQALLELKTKEAGEQRAKTAQLEAEMQAAEKAYFDSLYVGDSTGEQLYYTETQTALANATGYLEAAYGNLDQARVAYNQVSGMYNTALSNYNKIQANENALKGEMEAAFSQFETALANSSISNKDDYKDFNAIKGGLDRGDFNSDTSVKNAAEALVASSASYEKFLVNSAEAKAQYANMVEQYKVEKEAAESTKENYENDVDSYREQKNTANSNYESARDAYQSKVAYLNKAQADSGKLSNDYSQVSNKYNSEAATLASLEDAVSQLQVQVECDVELLGKQTTTIYSQFEATRAAVVDQLKKEASQHEEQLEKCTIRSSISGKVSDIVVVQGSAVSQGSQIARVKQGKEADNVVICYVPLNAGKKITEGMEVMVYPTTVSREEYGFMKATVESVASYVSSAESLQTQLGNNNLVEAFLKDGPVVAVNCRLQEDETTVSGYHWSSKKGGNLEITEGTLVEASVITEEKMPISMLIPYIKEKLTIRAKES